MYIYFNINLSKYKFIVIVSISSFRKDSLISQGMTGLTWKALITFRDHGFQLYVLN